MISKLVAVAVLLLALPASAAGRRCGTERWPVKTLTDPGASAVNLSAVVDTSVEALRALPAPVYDDRNSRARPERTVYRVTAKLVGFKQEADQDFHVVLAGDTGTTMIVEFPSPSCVAGSRVAAQVASARSAFVKRFGKPTPKFRRLKKPIKITVTGVGFFDKIHGQTGVAPNGIELHPVLSVK